MEFGNEEKGMAQIVTKLSLARGQTWRNGVAGTSQPEPKAFYETLR
jgi:hypothetical protein